MATIPLTDILTEDEIRLARAEWVKDQSDHTRLSSFAKTICKTLIEPNIERINARLGQKNDPMYLAYCIEFYVGHKPDESQTHAPGDRSEGQINTKQT